jgi:hypothetical protein
MLRTEQDGDHFGSRVSISELKSCNLVACATQLLVAKFGMKLLPAVAMASPNNHEALPDNPVPKVIMVQHEHNS